MKENIYYSSLFDIYGSLLSEKQRYYFQSYYFENFLLDEIATTDKVSKNAVSKQIKSAKSKLDYYESILHIKRKNDLLKNEFKNEKDILKRISKYDNIIMTKEEEKCQH